MTWSVLHLEHATRKGRAKCGATSGRVVAREFYIDSREGTPCPECQRAKRTKRKAGA